MWKKVRELIIFYENNANLTEIDSISEKKANNKEKVKYNVSLRRRPAIYNKRNSIYRTKSRKNDNETEIFEDLTNVKVVDDDEDDVKLYVSSTTTILQTPKSAEVKTKDIFTEDEETCEDMFGENDVTCAFEDGLLEAYNYPTNDSAILEVYNFNIYLETQANVTKHGHAEREPFKLPKYKSKSTETILASKTTKKKKNRALLNRSAINFIDLLDNQRRSSTFILDPYDYSTTWCTDYLDVKRPQASGSLIGTFGRKNSLSDENETAKDKAMDINVKANNYWQNIELNDVVRSARLFRRNSIGESDISRSSLRSSNRSYNRKSSLDESAGFNWNWNDLINNLQNNLPSVTNESVSSRKLEENEDVTSQNSFAKFAENEQINKEELTKIAKKTKYDYVVEELINTEKSYAKTLEDILNDYVNYLEDNFGVMLTEDVKKLINYLRNIFHKTIDFIEDLDRCNGKWEAIVRMFLKNRELFEIYPPYSLYKYKSDNFLRKQLMDILKERQLELKQSFDLPSYLLSPIQRLAKYKLLLNEFAKLDNSSKSLSHAIRLIDNQLRTGNNYIAIDSIKGLPYISEYELGSLVMRDTFYLKNIKKYESVVFLFEKVIVFTSPMDSEEFLYQFSIKMNDIGLGSHQSGTTSFDLLHYKNNSKNQKKEVIYTLEAKSLTVKKNWMRWIYIKLYEQMEEEKRKTTSVFQSYEMLTAATKENDFKKRKKTRKKKNKIRAASKVLDAMPNFTLY